MVEEQAEPGKFRFDFSGIQWTKNDPTSIVNAYRRALQQQEHQRKRRLLGTQADGSIRESSYAESSATLSPTIASATDDSANSNPQDSGDSANESGEFAKPSDLATTDRKRKAALIAPSNQRRQGGIKSTLLSLWQTSNPRSRLAKLSKSRRGHQFTPPPYFEVLKKRDSAAPIPELASVPQLLQPTAPVYSHTRIPSNESQNLQMPLRNSPIAPSQPRAIYVDSVTQTDQVPFEEKSKKRPLSIMEISTDRRQRPGFFSADFDEDVSTDEDVAPSEPEMQEPTLKKRRLLVPDGVNLANSPLFKSMYQNNGFSFKSGGGESTVAQRRQMLESVERQEQQKEREEQLKKEHEEQLKEFERQRQELEAERQRQEHTRRELEAKEQLLREAEQKRQAEEKMAKVAAATAAPSLSASITPAPAFSLGGAAPIPVPTTLLSGTSTPAPSGAATPAPFGFSLPPLTTSTSTQAQSTPFSFGSKSASSEPQATTNSSFKFDPTKDKSTANGSATISSSENTLPSLSTAPVASGFTFGTSVATDSDERRKRPTLSFGSSSTDTKSTPASTPSIVPPVATSSGFSFSLNGTSTAAPVSGQGATSTGFNFGSATSTAPALPGLTSGAGSSAAPTGLSLQPSLSFGASAPVSTSFQFGTGSSTTPTLAATPSTPQFSFGASSTSGPDPAAVFGFGAPSGGAATISTGGASGVATPSSSFAFGATATSAPAASSFTFGNSGPNASAGDNSNNMFAVTPESTPVGRKMAPMRSRRARR
ncbi:uncharacterized protein V1518DRAFT_412378 [Limtongia smithiae]|uniref:uncharacterized protein n=1 Tax=Limtongia smithiae TaxID=1125753 RepID=UPI0034CECD30